MVCCNRCLVTLVRCDIRPRLEDRRLPGQVRAGRSTCLGYELVPGAAIPLPAAQPAGEEVCVVNQGTGNYASIPIAWRRLRLLRLTASQAEVGVIGQLGGTARADHETFTISR